MPTDNAPPGPGSRSGSGSGSGPDSAPDRAFEQTLRELLDQVTRSVAAPADLTARVCASAPPRQRVRRRGLVLAAAALATSSVILGGLAVERHLASDSEVNVIMPAGGNSLSRPATSAPAHPGIPPTGVASLPSAAPTTRRPVDQATIDEITTAFAEAFDADDNIDDGLAYVQNGEQYHEMTLRFAQRYPGVAGNLRVRLENITLVAGDRANATVIITHTDPKLGEQWGYEIRRGGEAVRVDGRWLVSSNTYSFLVGTS